MTPSRPTFTERLAVLMSRRVAFPLGEEDRGVVSHPTFFGLLMVVTAVFSVCWKRGEPGRGPLGFVFCSGEIAFVRERSAVAREVSSSTLFPGLGENVCLATVLPWSVGVSVGEEKLLSPTTCASFMSSRRSLIRRALSWASFFPARYTASAGAFTVISTIWSAA